MAKDSREKILDAALKLFARKGFDGCSVDLIAAQAKVNKALIYYHFKNKAALYETVLEKNLTLFRQRVSEAVAREDSPEKKLEAFALTYAENFSGNRNMAPLVLRELASDGRHLTAKIRAIFRDIICEIDKILQQGQQEGVFRETKTFLPYFMIVGTMNIFTSTQRMRKKFYSSQHDEFGFSADPRETAGEIAAIVTAGLQSG